MTQTLHIAATPEPAKLHGGDETSVFYAVSLALEVAGEKESDGKIMIGSALEYLRDGDLHLFAVDTVAQKVSVVPAPVERVFFPKTEGGLDVMAWLDRARAQYGILADASDNRFYVNDRTGTANMRNATAFDLLRSAAKWPAPLAQDVGLMSAVSFPQKYWNANTTFVIVFLPKGADPTLVSFVSYNNDQAMLSIPWGNGGKIQALCTKLDPYNKAENLEPDGVFTLPTLADEARRTLRQIEELAPTALWPATALGSIAGEPGLLENVGLAPPILFHWIARASAVSMFDITIAGLLLPQSKTKSGVTRESLVLQRLSRFIADRFEQADFTLDVDEEQLYLNLHAALWGQLTKLTADTLWETLKTADQAYLPCIKEALTMSAGFTDVTAANWSAKLEVLSAELSEVALLLESETGAEAWILAQFDAVFGKGEKIPLSNSNIPEGPISEQNLMAAYAAFKADINGPYNAAEALRRDYGAEVMAAIAVDAAKLEGSSPFYRRFSAVGGPAKALDALYAVTIEAPVPDSGYLKKALEAASTLRIMHLRGKTPASVAFRPDPSPQPLHIPLASSISPTYFETIAENASGLGFLIYTKTKDNKVLARHINLIGIEIDKKNTAPCAVDPTLPLFSGGTAGMFLSYNGAPLSSPNQLNPNLGGQSAAQRAEMAAAKAMQPFTKLDANCAVPALAYGKAYGLSAFWLPPSGVLPVPLRADKTKPFTPKLSAEGAAGSVTFVPYQRRTAISEIQLVMDSDVSAKGIPVGRIPDGVQPLALDAPRIALGGQADGQRWRDIYRMADGTGALPAKTSSIELHGIELYGGLTLAEIDVLIMTDASTDGTSVALSPETFIRSKLKLPPQNNPFWLRIAIKAGNAAHSFSFTDPSQSHGQDSASHVAPLLVLAPKDNDNWAISNESHFKLTAPGVSFEDFERWARNKSLWYETCNASTRGAHTVADKLFADLRLAHAILHASDDAFAELMNRMPDPAVSGLYLGVAPTHHTTGPKATTAVSRFIEMHPYALENPPKLDIPDKATNETHISLAKAFITAFLESAHTKLKISAGETYGFTPAKNAGHLELTVPDGQIAQLWVSPAVATKHFEDCGEFYAGMTQLAVGTHGAYTLFDGPKTAIEIMDNVPETTSIPQVLFPKTEGVNRSYGLDIRLDKSMGIFSEAELTTQRWRHSGRPIYSWISPVQGASKATGPVILISPDIKNLHAFEADAFLGRATSDGDHARIRLLAAPESTEAYRFDWPDLSATYLRHRIVLISRYGAAMTSGSKSVSWEDWGARVAILADVQSATLTRPQFRAYLPMQRSISDKNKATVLPIQCVLSEPPFSQLGLAERLDADIQTTNTFKIKDEKLQLDGVRKEIGPDPLLSYFPINDTSSLGCHLRPEGPVGLHFDAAKTRAPAWSNSQFMLHLEIPETTTPVPLDQLEESFVGISLSRHADPDWCWSQEQNIGEHIDRDIWISVEDGFMLTSGGRTIVEIKKEPGFKISIAKSALFKDGGAELVTLWSGPFSALLLKPLGDGRYRMGVYVARALPDILDKGEIGRPQLVSSIFFKSEKPLILPQSKNISTRITLQSDATFMEWARTARDVSRFVNLDGGRVAPEDMLPRVVKVKKTYYLAMKSAIKSPVSARRMPLYVHRRLVYFIHHLSTQIGHKIPLFQHAMLADGTGCAILATHEPERTLSIGEMDVPAAICAANLPDGAHWEPYKTAYFDLYSSRSPRAPQQLKFHIRAANRPVNPHNLEIKLAGKTFTSASKGDTSVWSCDLVLWQGQDPAKTLFQLSWRAASGEHHSETVEIELDFANLVQQDSLSLSLSNVGEGEFWADISVLHSARAFTPDNPDAFDFDWLFGIASNESLPDALTPERLNSAEEAQGRLIGLSEPMPIT